MAAPRRPATERPAGAACWPTSPIPYAGGATTAPARSAAPGELSDLRGRRAQPPLSAPQESVPPVAANPATPSYRAAPQAASQAKGLEKMTLPRPVNHISCLYARARGRGPPSQPARRHGVRTPRRPTGSPPQRPTAKNADIPLRRAFSLTFRIPWRRRADLQPSDPLVPPAGRRRRFLMPEGRRQKSDDRKQGDC